MEPARNERAAEGAADVGAVVDERLHEAGDDRVNRPDEQHEADAPVAHEQTVPVESKEHDRGALQAEDRAGGPHRGAGADREAHQGARQPAQHVEHDELGGAERRLAQHAQDEERDPVADQVVHAAVEPGGAQEAPVFARGHALPRERAHRDDRFARRERADPDLDEEDRDQHHEDRHGQGRKPPHPPLEVDAAGEEHVGGDAQRRLGRGGHQRRSPVSSMTPSASAMRRSNVRPASAERSST